LSPQYTALNRTGILQFPCDRLRTEKIGGQLDETQSTRLADDHFRNDAVVVDRFDLLFEPLNLSEIVTLKHVFHRSGYRISHQSDPIRPIQPPH